MVDAARRHSMGVPDEDRPFTPYAHMLTTVRIEER
jgi:hypothetical protein